MCGYRGLCDLALNLGCKCVRDEPMSKHTTFKIGGPADLFINVTSILALKEILSYIISQNIEFFTVGNGSNLLVSDAGFRGVVLKLDGEFKEVKMLENSDTQIVCGGATMLTKVCNFAMQRGLSGLEFAWGIPASCGGATFMNAGAYNRDMGMVLKSSTHITPFGKVETVNRDEMNLSYRKSLYSDKNYVITSIIIELTPGISTEIKRQMDENSSKRRLKQPLNYPNCGSVFKRPGGGYYAAPLIEQCGLKGVQVGGACVSEKHSGFIVNKDNATCKDVVSLMEIIENKVYEFSGIKLQREVIVLGEV